MGRSGRGAALALGAVLALAACVSLRWEPIGPRRTAPVEGAEPVGAEECLVCHGEIRGHREIASYHADCESCHGSGSLHAASEAWDEIRFPANEDCLGCHLPGRDTHLQWGTGEHSRAGLFCSDCHDPHDPAREHVRPATRRDFPQMDAKSALCVDCHEDVAAHLRLPSHHPVPEGALACLSCHDPHEDSRLVSGERTQRCAGCHQDVMGPWVFEHPPAVEDCTLCHDPHGAVAGNLLETVQPVICLSCHTLNETHHPGASIRRDFPAPGSPEAIGEAEALSILRRCTDCHGAVHGSYTDELLRH